MTTKTCIGLPKSLTGGSFCAQVPEPSSHAHMRWPFRFSNLWQRSTDARSSQPGFGYSTPICSAAAAMRKRTSTPKTKTRGGRPMRGS